MFIKDFEIQAGSCFEVVEVLRSGFIDDSLFKIGGWTVAKEFFSDCFDCIPNGTGASRHIFKGETMFLTLTKKDEEVRSVGRLIVTKLKSK